VVRRTKSKDGEDKWITGYKRKIVYLTFVTGSEPGAEGKCLWEGLQEKKCVPDFCDGAPKMRSDKTEAREQEENRHRIGRGCKWSG
jgi:hypothetical protein